MGPAAVTAPLPLVFSDTNRFFFDEATQSSLDPPYNSTQELQRPARALRIGSWLRHSCKCQSFERIGAIYKGNFWKKQFAL